MKVYVMTLIMAPRPSVVHGAPVSVRIAASYEGASRVGRIETYTWLSEAWKPHACAMCECLPRRARMRQMWARTAHAAEMRETSRLALCRFLPRDMILRVLAIAARR
jgi:hypothetical protein